MILLLIVLSAFGADFKISDLPAGNGGGFNDVLPYVDSNLIRTKKLKLNDIVHLSSFHTSVVPGTYLNANINVDQTGRIYYATSGSTIRVRVVDGGDVNYDILFGNDYVRTSSTLLNSRNYRLPLCTSSNIGEQHAVKNTPDQTFNIVVIPSGSDTIDGGPSVTLIPGDSIKATCGVSGKWDL